MSCVLAHLNQNICMPAEKCIHFANKFLWCFLSFFFNSGKPTKTAESVVQDSDGWSSDHSSLGGDRGEDG